MQIQLLLQDNEKSTVYDASQLLVSATWSGELEGQPGKLAFDVVRDGSLTFYEGSPVQLVVEGTKLFHGWVFAKSRRDSMTTTVTAYDQLRYLKNTDARAFPESTASQRFTQLCAQFQLQAKVVHPSSYTLPAELFDNKTLGDMIQKSIDLTIIGCGKWYMVRDNFGTLEFLDLSELKTNLILGDASLMTGYSYQTSIDDDTFNQVKLIRENGESARREVYIVKDSETIAKWGLLQHYRTVEEGLNEAQIQQRAEQLLKQKNRVTRKLSLDCLGDLRVMPGNSVWVESQMDDMRISRYMLVHACSHSFKNKLHTMKVTLEVVDLWA